jgi:alkanesulfonate monooxygenase SsuD/methylene tetrahydromethanopterin reductase-like flavin-dependent oxidoreductase (luciferase family)
MVVFGTTVMAGPRRWADVAKAAEQSGFESVWVPEHLIMPVTMTGAPNTPHAGEPPISASTPAYDPWVQIATMAAVTSSIRFGTHVYNIGLRHPIVTARALATVDVVSGGRIEFGIGASWVDESIRIIQRLFTEEVIEHDGEFFRFQPVGFLPKPAQQPWPPMHIGGDSPAAMRRAAELGDGWIPMQQSLETLPGNLAQIDKMRSERGRSGPFQVTVGARVTSVDDVRRYEDAGATRLLVTPFTNPREASEGFRRFGDEIIAKL